MAYIYCSKCGLTGISSKNDINKEKCGYCNTVGTCKNVPDKYLINDKFNYNLENEFIEECVKKSDSFSYCSYINREKYFPFIPKCPTCQCHIIKRISPTERFFSIFSFGIFSNSFNKTFKCNNCGYKW